MSNRYDLIDYCSYRDNETGKISDNFVGVLNEQDKKIKELEHRLSNCIEPKFKIGQEVWIVFDGVKKDVIENNWFLCSLEKSRLGLYEDYLFATEEEALKKFEELKK